MHGAMICCSVHHKVYNAEKRFWQDVPVEMLEELREMAQELDNVDVHEGCCDECSLLAHASFRLLHQQRLASAAYKECGSSIRLPWDEEYWE